MTQICACVSLSLPHLSRYCSVVPRVAPQLLTVHLQFLLQLLVQLLRRTLQDELISGELIGEQRNSHQHI